MQKRRRPVFALRLRRVRFVFGSCVAAFALAGLPSRSKRAQPAFEGFGAAAFAALRLRRLVGGDGIEPPTSCV
jgi:hypothetical protein